MIAALITGSVRSGAMSKLTNLKNSAFGTGSSSATLPQTFACLESKFLFMK